jgi:hypothetical protein
MLTYVVVRSAVQRWVLTLLALLVFTSAKVQMLTPEELRARCCVNVVRAAEIASFQPVNISASFCAHTYALQRTTKYVRRYVLHMLTYSHVCSRMLMYAGEQRDRGVRRYVLHMLTYAHVCWHCCAFRRCRTDQLAIWRMLTYAHVC